MNQETKQFINRIVSAYLYPEKGIVAKGNPPRAKLKTLAEVFHISSSKIRKILVGEGVYENKNSAIVGKLRAEGKSVDEIIKITGLSKSSVNNYLAYEKGMYKNELADESLNNNRVLKHRENKTMEDCVGSALASSPRKRVLFFSKTDLSISYYIGYVKEYLMEDHEITTIQEAIHAYNCYLFINNGIRGKDWSENETDLIIQNAKIIKNKVCRFLFAKPSVVLDEIEDLEWDYKRSVLRIAASVNLYKKWSREQFQMMLNDSLIRDVLEIEKIVRYFDREITDYLMQHIEITAEVLFDNNTIQIGNSFEMRYHLPPSFGLDKKVLVLRAYCHLENPSINGLISVLNMKDVLNRIGEETIELIRRTIDVQTIERMNQIPMDEKSSLGLSVRFLYGSSVENEKPKDDGIFYLDYPLEELDTRLDYEGIQFCLKRLFGFVDLQNGLVSISRNKKDFSLIDDLLGSKFKNGYNVDSHQHTLMEITYGTLALYYNYLKSKGISLEKHLGHDFSSYLATEYQIDLAGFELPDCENSFLTKCTTIASTIESLLKRIYLLEQGRDIDKYSLSSVSGVRFSSLDSILPDKYLYITNNKQKAILVNNLSYLLFSFQHLFLINKDILDEQEVKNNFYLLMMKNITRSEIMECDQPKVEYLLNNKCVVEHNGCLKPTNRALALKELWDNGCITTYHSPCGFRVLATLKSDGWLVSEKKLLAKPEQELLSFIYDNQLFSDAWGLRNCYAHGAAMHLDEDQHKQNYMWFLYVIIVLELKLVEEIEVCQMMKKQGGEKL